MKIHKCLYTAQCIVPEAENLSPNYSHDLEVFSCLDFFLDHSYLVSCRTHLYRLPGVKRSSRLITGGTVHKIDCALQSSIKFPSTDQLGWKNNAGVSALPGAERYREQHSVSSGT